VFAQTRNTLVPQNRCIIGMRERESYRYCQRRDTFPQKWRNSFPHLAS